MNLADALSKPFVLSGIPTFFRRIFFKHSVTILVYHNPVEEVFDRHVAWLVDHYNVISIDEMYEGLQSNDVYSLGEYPLLITIDDGRKENYQLLSVIKKYGIRPCFYLCSSVVNTNRKLWDDFIVEYAPHKLEYLKSMSEFTRREYLSSSFGITYEDEGSTREMLSDTEIHEMLPYVDFASHGCFHQPFSSLTDEEMEREAIDSKREIECITGVPCKHFSYPTGMYDARCESILKKAGYISARTTDYGGNRSVNDIYYLKGIGVSDDATLDKLKVQSSGLYSFLKRMLMS